MAAKNFITNETNVNVESRTVELSKLLLWYREDFIKKGNETMSFSKKAVHYAIISKNIPIKWLTSINKDDMILLEFVYDHIKDDDEKKQSLKTLMESKGSCKITYAPYDFDINIKK